MPTEQTELYEVLRDFFEEAPVGLHWQLCDGTIQAGNRALSRLLGCEADALANANFFDFCADADVAFDLQRRLAAGETLHSQKIILRACDGNQRHVLFSASALFKDGQFVRARCFTRDIPLLNEAIQALAKANARKAAILDASLDAIITMDAQGWLVDFNHAAERIFGYSRKEAIQQRLSTLLIPPRLREAHEIGLRRYFETGHGPVLGRRIEIQAMRANGEEFPVELSIAVVHEDPPMFTATLRDITERKRSEAALQESLAALQRSENALREADRRKDEFLAMLAHELRNPLAPVRTAAEILAHHDLAQERKLRAAAVVRRQVSIMSRLLDDLLDIARVTRGKLELQPTSKLVLDTVRIACETTQPSLEAKQQTLTTDLKIPETLVATMDHVRIAQVLSNLLTNASKYSDENTTVCLRACLKGADLVLEVQDQGIGFKPEDALDVFNMFSQLPESRGREQGGLGIGLALALKLTRLHGGTLEASSPGPGKGATFTLTLPLTDGR